MSAGNEAGDVRARGQINLNLRDRVRRSVVGGQTFADIVGTYPDNRIGARIV